MEADKGETKAVKRLREHASQMRARYEAAFIGAKGEFVKEKKNGKKVNVPDFEEGEVGILPMTRTQFESFTGLRKDEKFKFMKGPQDLVNRVIVADKAKRGGSDYATIEFIPSSHISDPPDLEYDEDDFDLDARYEIDEDIIEKIMLALDGDDEDDDGLDMDEEDFNLDDDDDDDDDEEVEDDDDADDDDDLDFDDDDDDIFDDEEEEEVPKKKSKKTSSKKKGKGKKK